MNHGEIAEAAAHWLSKPFQRAVMRECGLPTCDRADIVAFDVATSDVRIIEVKANAVDARHLPEQLERYRPWCDYLYVAIPEELVDVLPDLPKRVGLIVARQCGPLEAKPHGHLVRRPCRVTMEIERRQKMQRRTLTWLLRFYTMGLHAGERAWIDGDEWTPGEAASSLSPSRNLG